MISIVCICEGENFSTFGMELNEFEKCNKFLLNERNASLKMVSNERFTFQGAM